MPIRSGRFRVKVTDITKPFTIIKGRTGAFYRIFNSGAANFIVKSGAGGPNEATLNPTFSLDVAVVDDVQITAENNNDVVEGIYDFLNSMDPVRSGRFKIDTTKMPDPHKIIDLQGVLGADDSAWYRIFNSGDTIMQVGRGTKYLDIAASQSFDFELRGGSQKDIYVKAKTPGEPIEGIYEFLGRS